MAIHFIESHGQRSLVGYSPWGCKESDTTEQLNNNIYTYIHMHTLRNSYLWKKQEIPIYVFKMHNHRTGKGQFSFQFQRKAMPKNVQTTTQMHSIHVLTR